MRLGVCVVHLDFLPFFLVESGSFFVTGLASNSSSTFAGLQVCVTAGRVLLRPCELQNQHCSSCSSSTSEQRVDESFPPLGSPALHSAKQRKQCAETDRGPITFPFPTSWNLLSLITSLRPNSFVAVFEREACW